MKTIAVTIDEATLGLIDHLTSKSDRKRSRSALVRKALREFAERHQRQHAEARDRDLLSGHRDMLRAEAEALVRDQAKP